MPSGPGYQLHPEHTVKLNPRRARVTVMLDGRQLASTDDAIRLEEGKYPPVYYLPRADVDMSMLERSDHQTHCPFKGDASYFSFVGGARNAVWSYETPYDEVAAIKERLAFYPHLVSIEVAD
jgi:uncharacterized protein (DUF427 family)